MINGKVKGFAPCCFFFIPELEIFELQVLEYLTLCYRFMMCCSGQDLRETAEWAGKGVESRTKLIEKLQSKTYSDSM